MTCLIATEARTATGLDFADLLDLVGDDRDFLEQFTSLFEQDSARLIVEIREATARPNGAALERSAHALKGLLSHFGDSPALDCCRRLEALGSSCQPAEGAALADALGYQVALIRQGLARISL